MRVTADIAFLGASIAAYRFAPWGRLREANRLNVFLATIVSLSVLRWLRAGIASGMTLHVLGAMLLCRRVPVHCSTPVADFRFVSRQYRSPYPRTLSVRATGIDLKLLYVQPGRIERKRIGFLAVRKRQDFCTIK